MDHKIKEDEPLVVTNETRSALKDAIRGHFVLIANLDYFAIRLHYTPTYLPAYIVLEYIALLTFICISEIYLSS
jgi:hypothetical protein